MIDSADNLSIDDGIMTYLLKKGITDKSEKLALARISSKMEISSQQVEMSINRLSAKNFIRKIYSPGRVGFELTPKGKQAIEALAKAETAKVIAQLQKAIQQERKAKLRLSTVNKMKAIEDAWKTYQIPDGKQIHETELEATILLAATKEIAEKQPLCHVNPQNYDQEFLQYKLQIEKMTEQNKNLTKEAGNYAKIRDCLISISVDIENVNKTINKYELIAEAKAQTNQLKTSLFTLKSIQSQLGDFDKEQISRFELVKTQLADNSRILEMLMKPTHEFAPMKRESITEKAAWYPDPEGQIKPGHKTSEYPLVEKCGKCGARRSLTSIDFG